MLLLRKIIKKENYNFKFQQCFLKLFNIYVLCFFESVQYISYLCYLLLMIKLCYYINYTNMQFNFERHIWLKIN